MLNKTLKNNAIILVSVFGLAACGGGSGGFKAKVKDGVFKDSNVSGLTYVYGDNEDITGSKGEFKYEEGKSVSFSVGGVDLGTGKAKPVMTPVDLVENGKLTSDEVINKARFLMMLDKNNDPNDGIEISSSVREKAKDWQKVDFASDNFPTAAVYKMITQAALADGKEHELPNKETALAHLKTTLICSSSGVFTGTYTGTEAGKLVFVINPVTGDVMGSTLKEGSTTPLLTSSTSQVEIDNEFKFVSTDASARQFTGKLASSDEMVGSWANTDSAGNKGNFSAKRIGGKSDALYRYSVIYKNSAGDKRGAYTFDVDAHNKIKGTAYDLVSGKQQDLSGKLTENTLTVTLDDGTQLTGLINNILSITGAWVSSGANGQDGIFEGGGCLLN